MTARLALALALAAWAGEAGAIDVAPLPPVPPPGESAPATPAAPAAPAAPAMPAAPLPEAITRALDATPSPAEPAAPPPAPGGPRAATPPPARPAPPAASPDAAPAPRPGHAPPPPRPLEAAEPPARAAPAPPPARPAGRSPASDRAAPAAAPLTAPPPRPRPRHMARLSPGPVIAAAVFARPAPAPREPAPRICDDPRLAGQTITRIASATPGCGIERPVRLSAVAGVRLDRPAIGDCRLASRLADWIEKVARPAARGLGSELVSIEVAASYACRPRNNRPGARLSEHARGRAIDIAAFRLADGRRITVLDGWRGKARAFLARLHRRACGIFGTVLGPDSDRWHRNHFHFDVARYRMGSYCR